MVGIDDSVFYDVLKNLKKEGYLTTKKAGEILGISKRTIQRRIKVGEVKAVNRKEFSLKGRG